MTLIDDRLEKAEAELRKKGFRNNKGLSNEVSYYIFDYPPQEELTVRNRITRMKESNTKGTHGFQIIEFDLYDLVMEILDKEAVLEKCYDLEQRKGLNYVTKAVNELLRINDDNSLIVAHIKEHTPENSIVFLTGVGKCYPLLRAHKILNNLHQAMDNVPVVMFYPGRYTKDSLELFGKTADGNYYRAFRLVP
jgi:hypothetical protein